MCQTQGIHFTKNVLTTHPTIISLTWKCISLDFWYEVVKNKKKPIIKWICNNCISQRNFVHSIINYVQKAKLWVYPRVSISTSWGQRNSTLFGPSFTPLYFISFSSLTSCLSVSLSLYFYIKYTYSKVC